MTVARPEKRGRRRVELANTLRLSRHRWEQVRNDDLTRAALVVVGAWIILAWARFGAQGFNGMRAFTRFVLVGVYAWFGLTAALWMVARIRSRMRPASVSNGDERQSPWTLLAMVGLAQQPLLIGGAVLWFLQIAPHSVLNAAIGTAAVAWMGGQLVAAVGAFERRSSLSSASASATLSSLSVPLSTVAIWLLWLATAGRFLAARVGHLA